MIYNTFATTDIIEKNRLWFILDFFFYNSGENTFFVTYKSFEDFFFLYM